MGYPVVTAGMVMAPRGIGTMVSMLIVGRLIGRVDTRLLLGHRARPHRLVVLPDDRMDPRRVAGDHHRRRRSAGRGPGLSVRAAERRDALDAAAAARTEGAGLYNLSRNIGSSVGISVVNALLVQNTQVNHAAIVPSVSAVNRGFENPAVAHAWDPLTAAGRAALDAVITKQAQIIAYIDDYKFLMIATLAVLPLLMVFRKPSGAPPAEPIVAE